jgi:hypothetical protein
MFCVGVKNAKKRTSLKCLQVGAITDGTTSNAMMAAYNNLQDSDTMASGHVVTPRRKEVQCTFQLMKNILVSDEFACEFATLGDGANRATLDSGKGGSNQLFWECIQDSFAEPSTKENNRLYFTDDNVFAAQGHINPKQIVEHDWQKLRVMWKSSNADYKSPLTRFPFSGTHHSNFFGYCGGKLEPHYLRKNLERRPDLTSTVESELISECYIASEMAALEVQDKVCGPPAGRTFLLSSSNSTGLPGKEATLPSKRTLSGWL